MKVRWSQRADKKEQETVPTGVRFYMGVASDSVDIQSMALCWIAMRHFR